MPTVFTYRDLEVWQAAMVLVEQVYRLTVFFPKFELYALTSQIRRAAVSVPSNIAEGSCRRTTKAYANHVSIALGSYGELETCIEIAERLGYIRTSQKADLQRHAAPVGRMLNRLYQSLERKIG